MQYDVVVVGGGNSAGLGAMFLSEHTRHVWLLLRGSDLRESMSSYLAGRVEAAEEPGEQGAAAQHRSGDRAGHQTLTVAIRPVTTPTDRTCAVPDSSR